MYSGPKSGAQSRTNGFFEFKFEDLLHTPIFLKKYFLPILSNFQVSWSYTEFENLANIGLDILSLNLANVVPLDTKLIHVFLY